MIKFMVKKNKMEKHWERRYGEEEIETFEFHVEENQESYHWKLQSMQENIILLIINPLLWFTSISFIYRLL